MVKAGWFACGSRSRLRDCSLRNNTRSILATKELQSMNRFNTALLCLLLAAGCKPGTSTVSGGDPEIVGNEATFFSGVRLITGDGSPPIDKASIILYKGKIHQIAKEEE